MARKTAVAVLVLGASLSLLAAGTLVQEQGARAAALGNAFAARADDPSALFYNPAGLAFFKEGRLAVNLTYIRADLKYKSPTVGTWRSEAKNFFVPAAFYVHPLTDSVVFGVGAFAPYNLSTDWREPFPGRFVNRHSSIVTTDLRPVLAWRATERSAFALGLDLYDAQIVFTRALDTRPLSYPLPSEAGIDTHVRDQAVGFTAAWFFRGDLWTAALTYQSSASFDFEGHASIEPDPILGPLNAFFPGQRVRFSLKAVPATWTAAFTRSEGPWTFGIDLSRTEWSAWDAARVHFSRPTLLLRDETLFFDWQDTWAVRAGLSYRLDENWELLFGAYFDETPVPDRTLDPSLPQGDSWALSGGVSYRRGRLSLDAYAMAVRYDDRAIVPGNIYRYNVLGQPYTPDGKYTASAWQMGLQAAYRF